MDFLDFRGSLLANNQVQLDWETASEENLSHFIVERSVNAVDFQGIGEVMANNAQNYRYIDASPNAALMFYRLRAVDLDGKEQFSSIISIKNTTTISILSIFPNPAKASTSLIIHSNQEVVLQLKVLNLLGQQLEKQEFPLIAGNNFISLDLKGLSTGVYLLHLGNGTIWRTTKLVVDN